MTDDGIGVVAAQSLREIRGGSPIASGAATIKGMLSLRNVQVGVLVLLTSGCGTEDAGGGSGNSTGDTEDDTTGTATGPGGEDSTTTTAPSSSTDSTAAAESETTDVTDGGTANARCGEVCDALVGAACTNGLTNERCLGACGSLTSSPTCDDVDNTYFDCLLDTGATCDQVGDPVGVGCGFAYLAAIECAVSQDSNPDLIEPCMNHCATVGAADCAFSLPEADCNTNCRWLGDPDVGCEDEWTSYLSCFSEAPVSCLQGYAAGVGCGPAFMAYTECANATGQ